MNEKVNALATAAGARTEADFALFAHLASLRDQFLKLRVPRGAPPVDGIALRYDHCLAHGRFYEPQPLPRGYRRGRRKDCYNNSLKLALADGGLTNCEGYALLSLGDGAADVEHGWCVTAEGKVIDVTLKEAGLSYFGVPFTLEQVAAAEELPIVDGIVAEQLTGRTHPADPS